MKVRIAAAVAVAAGLLAGLAWLGVVLWSRGVVQAVPGGTQWLVKAAITGKAVKGVVVVSVALVAGTASLVRYVRGRLRRPR